MVGAGSFWLVFGIIHPETSKTPILLVEGGGGVIMLTRLSLELGQGPCLRVWR